jgi:hypothetical protein
MISLANTTYYPAILLRKRWLEAGSGRVGAFDLASELERLQTEPPLNSVAVGELERWCTGIEAAHARRLDRSPVTNEPRGDQSPDVAAKHLATFGASRERLPGRTLGGESPRGGGRRVQQKERSGPQRVPARVAEGARGGGGDYRTPGRGRRLLSDRGRREVEGPAVATPRRRAGRDGTAPNSEPTRSNSRSHAPVPSTATAPT